MPHLVKKRSARRFVALAVLAATGAFLAACGGGSSSDGGATTSSGGGTTAASATTAGGEKVAASAWVKDFCGALTTWQTSLTEGVPDFSNVSDVGAVKTTLTNYLGDVVDSTRTLVSDVEAAGTPDVTDGEAIASDLQSELTKVGDAFETAKSEVDDLPTNDPTALATGLQKIATEITDAGNQAGSALGDLGTKYPDSSALSEAAANEPACSTISGS